MTTHQDYLPAELREFVESNFYAKVNEQTSLENLIQTPSFIQDPEQHIGLFSDHGVVHMRDVAKNVLLVLELANGVLIPVRDRSRLEFMKGYGVLLAYLHDIGMLDFSDYGRAMHPEFAAHMIFNPQFDPWIDRLWEDNVGNLSWHLTHLIAGPLDGNARTFLRELLALSFCHSKSTCPVADLNDPQRLRALALQLLTNELTDLYQSKQTLSQPPRRTGRVPADIARFYSDIHLEAYSWLTADNPALEEFRADVVDTIRALHAADALRKRGTVLKTSGGYQIFID
jgi:hypothetical protein